MTNNQPLNRATSIPRRYQKHLAERRAHVRSDNTPTMLFEIYVDVPWLVIAAPYTGSSAQRRRGLVVAKRIIPVPKQRLPARGKRADTDYTREEICISHNCRPRLSVCVHGLISRSARFRPSNVSPSIECKGRSVSPSLTDKTTVFVPNNGCGPFIDPPIIGTPPNAGTNFSRIRTCLQRFRKIRNISRIFRKQFFFCVFGQRIFLHSLFHREKWQATTKLIILRKLEFDRERDNGRIGLLSNLCSIFRCWKTAKRFIDKGQWLNKAGDV